MKRGQSSPPVVVLAAMNLKATILKYVRSGT
jgi:hypothetical protein